MYSLDHNHYITNFYQNHPEFNFEEVNIKLVDILSNGTKTNSDQIESNILKTIKGQESLFTNIYNKIFDLEKTIVNHKNEQLTYIDSKTTHQNEVILNGIQKSNPNNNSQLLDIISELKKQMESVFHKMQNSNIRGKLSENMLLSILTQMFPNFPIEETNKQKESGDFIVDHNLLGLILFENKDYTYNVPKQEVEKFIRDVNLKESHGIFLSQNSGIANKNMFQIEFSTKGKVIVYLHNVNYDYSLISYAVSIINQFADIAKREYTNTNKDEYNISKDTILHIIEEWNKVKNTNVEIIKNLQEQIKKLQKQTMNSLEHITQIFFPSQNKPKYQCECGKVVASRAALVSHKRHCKYLQEIQYNESMEM